MDLFSRPEHDEDAQSILGQSGCGVPGPRRRTASLRLLPTMERAEIIRTSLEGLAAR